MMFRLSLLLSILLLPIATFGESSQKNWQAALEPRCVSNGYRQGVGVEFFIPALQRESALTFGQALAGRFQNEWVGSVGLGYRQVVGVWAFGVNGFIDGVQADRKTYGQGGVGAEVFGPCFEGRINGYFPFTRVKGIEDHSDQTLSLAGTMLMQSSSYNCLHERTYAGFDIEAGYGRDVLCGSLWGYAGYYHFSTHKLEDIQGPRVRLVYRYDNLLKSRGSQLIAGLLYEYDQVHGNRFGVEIGIRIPLGRMVKSVCASPSSLCRRIGYRIVRQEGILKRCELHETVNPPAPVLTASGNPREVFFVHNGEIGEGTVSSGTTLADAVERAGPGAMILLSNAKGGIETDGVVLKKGQQLCGFGELGEVSIKAKGLALKVVDKEGRAFLIGPKEKGAVVTLGEGSTVSGLEIVGGLIGLYGENVSDIVLSDLHVNGAKRHGVKLANVNNAHLDQLVMSQIGEWAIKADKTSNLRISRVTATEGVDKGIWIDHSFAPTIDGACLELNGEEGIRFYRTDKPTLSSSSISGKKGQYKVGDGIHLSGVNDALLDRVTLEGIAWSALLAEKVAGIELKQCHIETNADEAIRIVDGSNISLVSSYVSGGKRTLIALEDVSGAITFRGNTFEGAGSKDQGAIELITVKKEPIAFTFSKNKIQHCKGEGVKCDIQGEASFDLIFSQNALNTLEGTGVWVRQNGENNQIAVAIDRNTFAGLKRGILLKTGFDASESTFRYTIDNNTFSDTREEGVFVTHEAVSKEPVALLGKITNNRLSQTKGSAISLFSDLARDANHQLVADVRSNKINEGAREAIAVKVDNRSGGSIELILKDNRDIGQTRSVPYLIDIGSNYVGHATLQESGNTSNRGEGVTISDNSGSLHR